MSSKMAINARMLAMILPAPIYVLVLLGAEFRILVVMSSAAPDTVLFSQASRFNPQLEIIAERRNNVQLYQVLESANPVSESNSQFLHASASSSYTRWNSGSALI